MSGLLNRPRRQNLNNITEQDGLPRARRFSVRAFGNILGAITGIVPLPFTQPVSHVVKTAFDRAETVADNRKRCKELQNRAEKLINLVSVAEQDEKTSPEVTETLEKSKESLHAIQKQLNDWTRSRDSPKELYKSFKYHRFLAKCQVELEDIRFNLMLETTLAMRAALMKMGEGVAPTEASNENQTPLQESTICETPQRTAPNQTPEQSSKHTHFKILLWLGAFFLAILDKILLTSLWISRCARQSPPRSSGLPAPPEYFFGRDNILNEMIGNVVTGVHQGAAKHMALYGAIGTGKSTIARMFVNRVEVARTFGRSRHWVRCQSAPNVNAMLQALAASLFIETQSNHPLADITSYLQVNPSSLLIVFDDFLMPENQTEIEALKVALEQLDRFANVCILLTTRDLPLPEGVGWLHFLVRPLSVDAAIATFKAISGYPDDHDDEIKELVQALGCLPFSISIVARLRPLFLKPAAILEQLELGEDEELNEPIDRIVRMSLSSSRFTDNPSALILLCILSRLPKGALYDNLAKIARHIQNPVLQLKTLLASGHVSRETDGFILVQAPTRSYISRYHALEARHLHALREYYFQICEEGGYDLGTEEFRRASKALVMEGENTRAVLLDALQKEPTTAALSAVVGYANFLYNDIPNVDITDKAINVIESNPSLDANGTLLPRCLFGHGKLLFRLDRYLEAMEILRKAIVIWQKTDDFANLGHIHVLCGQIYRILGRQTQSLESCSMAREYFEKVQDRAGITESLQGLAITSLKAGDFEKAVQLLDQAKEQCGEHGPSITSISFCMGWVLRYKDASYSASLLLDAREAYVKYGTRYRAFLCIYQMGIAQYSSGRYKEAEESLLLSYQEAEEVGSYGQMGYALCHLVELEMQKGNIKQALQYNGEALSLFKKLEIYADVSMCYVSRGRVLTKMGQINEARQAYNNARAIIAQRGGDSKLKLVADQEMLDLDQKSGGWRRLFGWL